MNNTEAKDIETLERENEELKLRILKLSKENLDIRNIISTIKYLLDIYAKGCVIEHNSVLADQINSFMTKKE